MALLRRRQAGWSERVLVRAQHETVDSRRLVVGHLFVHRLGLAGSRRGFACSLGIGRWDIQGRGQLTLVARCHAAAAAAAAAGQQLVAYQGRDRSPWAAAYRVDTTVTCRGAAPCAPKRPNRELDNQRTACRTHMQESNNAY